MSGRQGGAPAKPAAPRFRHRALPLPTASPPLLPPPPACSPMRSLNLLPYPPGTGVGGFRGDAERWPGGGVEGYLQRLAAEVLPLVRQTWGAASDPARVAFGGGSFAGGWAGRGRAAEAGTAVLRSASAPPHCRRPPAGLRTSSVPTPEPARPTTLPHPLHPFCTPTPAPFLYRPPGVTALYAALHYPHLFGAVLAESPSLWIAEGRFLQVSQQPPPAGPRCRSALEPALAAAASVGARLLGGARCVVPAHPHPPPPPEQDLRAHRGRLPQRVFMGCGTLEYSATRDHERWVCSAVRAGHLGALGAC